MSDLPPFDVDDAARTVRVTLRIEGLGPRTVTVSVDPNEAGIALIGVAGGGRSPSGRSAERVVGAVRHVLRMDEDLSGFYARIAEDPALAWAAAGAGRMIRSQTVFEDVVKTICTTNCTWSATQRMIRGLVAGLGEAAPGAPHDGWLGRTFPTPEAMAGADERFYREVVKAGYRGAYLTTLARSVTDGSVDLEALAPSAPAPPSDDEVEAALLALPGVGPYAAAHVMMTLGRHSRLILDSWTRPTYARVIGRTAPPSDAAIRRRFARYREHAGLAFWLFLTKDWVADAPPEV
jgi:N-glycosylase/DNA lyase